MTKTQFRLGVGALFAAILLFNLTSPDRYFLIKSGTSSSAFKVFDGVTGKVVDYRWVSAENDWVDRKDIKIK
tara:strand:+ start:299 stop:514 length:216 start_codon:yes stop_codon:yes gene_type:complete